MANPTKWPNTPKQFVARLPTNCLSVFDHFVKSALKGLSYDVTEFQEHFPRTFEEYKIKQIRDLQF